MNFFSLTTNNPDFLPQVIYFLKRLDEKPLKWFIDKYEPNLSSDLMKKESEDWRCPYGVLS